MLTRHLPRSMVFHPWLLLLSCSVNYIIVPKSKKATERWETSTKDVGDGRRAQVSI